MKRLIALFLLIIPLSGYAQNQQKLPPPPPPPASMPNNDLIPLIDELIKVSEFEKAFKEYCNTKIIFKGSQLNWTKEMIMQKNSQVDFESFKQTTIYNAYSFFTKEELEETIKLMKDLNKNRKFKSPYFISNSSISNNMDVYIKGLLE
jgi:hypothetical protein